MKNTRNQTLTALFLITIVISMSFITTVNSATPVEIETRLFISAVPNPVGVGQKISIMWWLAIPNPVAGTTWENAKVTITKPDGKVETFGPLTSDINGGAYVGYVPDIAGNYTIQASFAGQWVNTTGSNGYNRWYVPLESKKLTVTVQTDPISVEPELPMPTEYWTRPINAENREWYKIAGNWLMGKGDKDAIAFEGSGSWQKYSTGPNTGHILWTKELLPGGIAGEAGYGIAYYGGLNYEANFRPPIIMNGILYYETAQPPRYGINAVDMRTGETLWYRNYSYGDGFNALKMGQILDYETLNQHGTLAYLWFVVGSTWYMHDAFTGNFIVALSGVPNGYIQRGPIGEILIYTVNNAQGWVQMWNSSAVYQLYGANTTSNYSYYTWRPERFQGQTINGTTGVQWRVNVSSVPGAGNSIQWLDENLGVLVTTNQVQRPADPWPTFVHAGYSTKTGQLLWTANRTNIGDMKYPVYVKTYTGLYALPYREAKQWIVWDMQTGQEKWRLDNPEDDWGIFDVGAGFVNDLFLTAGFAGILTAYNMTTGKKQWEFYSGDAGFDTTYGTWGFYGSIIMADGKIYIAHNEHSPDQPLWRGMKMWAIDEVTGKGIWNISGAYQGGRNAMGALADGILVSHNAMDNRIYAFGKGPSATTVTASPKVSTQGSSILIEGTVLDIAAGTKGSEQSARFPYGVPAISDKYQTPWMEYVYMQRPKPTDATGVDVTLKVLDPNGNIYEIGIATSDSSGTYSFLWEPPVPGKYTLTATFAGTESYWPSYTQTAFGVSETPQTSPIEQPQVKLPPIEIYVVGTGVAIILAIAIAAILIIKKRS